MSDRSAFTCIWLRLENHIIDKINIDVKIAQWYKQKISFYKQVLSGGGGGGGGQRSVFYEE